MKLKRNRMPVKIVAAILVACVLLQGCSSHGLRTTNELTICIDEHYYPMLKSILRDYAETYPNVKITYEFVKRDNTVFAPLIDEDYRETTLRHLQTEIMSGKGPDLFILDSGYNGECFFKDLYKSMQAGVFCDLLPLLHDAGISENDFIKPVFDAGKIDGKQYIAPLEYQVYAMLTTEDSRQSMGAERIKNTADMLNGIRAAMAVPGTSAQPIQNNSKELFSGYSYSINPYYYAAKPLVDYETNTVQIDTPLTRNILETGKFASDKLKEYKLVKQPEDFNTSWFGYVRSNRNLTYCPYFLVALLNSTGAVFYGRTMHVDPIPSEDGGVCAVVSSFAGIRANSGNKQNAVNLIKLLLSEKYQISKNGAGHAYPSEGYPVRKGVMERRLHEMIPGGEQLWSPISWSDYALLNNETRQDFINIEARITTAMLPTPRDVNDILSQYYAGDIDIDTALRQLKEYGELSLSE